jgi:hypothetical protein
VRAVGGRDGERGREHHNSAHTHAKPRARPNAASIVSKTYFILRCAPSRDVETPRPGTPATG